jgi:hypothetical protein
MKFTGMMILTAAFLAATLGLAHAQSRETPIYDKNGRYSGSVFDYGKTQINTDRNGHFSGSASTTRTAPRRSTTRAASSPAQLARRSTEPSTSTRDRTMKTLLTAVSLLAMIGSASAETYTYACQVTGVDPNPNNTYLYSAMIDTAKHTVTWRGLVFKNAKQLSRVFGQECAKWCFGNNEIALSTATQGVATLTVATGEDHEEEFECDMVRRR